MKRGLSNKSRGRETLILIISLVLFFFFISFLPTQAASIIDKKDVYLGKATLQRGYTLKSKDEQLIIGVWPNILSKPTKVSIEKIRIKNIFLPERKNMISDLYVFDFKGRSFEDFKRPYTLILKYNTKNSSHRAIYFYNHQLKKWSEVAPAEDNTQKRYIRVKLKFPYAQIAILEEKPEIGIASWYKFGYHLTAAHPYYPRGTRLKVTNLENNKSVIVRVNDTGPDKRIHPERVIDLNSVSFSKLASLKRGLIKVKVEKL